MCFREIRTIYIYCDIALPIYTFQGNHCVRRVDSSTLVITTYAGGAFAGYNGDGGPASSAQLNGPLYICFDASGNLFISDFVRTCSTGRRNGLRESKIASDPPTHHAVYNATPTPFTLNF